MKTCIDVSSPRPATIKHSIKSQDWQNHSTFFCKKLSFCLCRKKTPSSNTLNPRMIMHPRMSLCVFPHLTAKWCRISSNVVGFLWYDWSDFSRGPGARLQPIAETSAPRAAALATRALPDGCGDGGGGEDRLPRKVQGKEDPFPALRKGGLWNNCGRDGCWNRFFFVCVCLWHVNLGGGAKGRGGVKEGSEHENRYGRFWCPGMLALIPYMSGRGVAHTYEERNERTTPCHGDRSVHRKCDVLSVFYWVGNVGNDLIFIDF